MTDLMKVTMCFNDEQEEFVVMSIHDFAEVIYYAEVNTIYGFIFPEPVSGRNINCYYNIRKIRVNDESFATLIFGVAGSEDFYIYTLKERDEEFHLEIIENKLLEWIEKEMGKKVTYLLVCNGDV